MADNMLEAGQNNFDAEKQMDDSQDAFASIQKALEELDNAFGIQDTGDINKLSEMGGHIDAALEAIGLESEQNGFKAAINKVIALIMRSLEYAVDYFKDSNIKAGKYINFCNTVLAGLSTLPATTYIDGDVTNQVTLTTLSFEGNTPRFLARELENLFSEVIHARKFIPTREIRNVLNESSKNGDVAAAFAEFHSKLEQGLESLGPAQSQTSKALFSNLDGTLPIHSSKRLIGDRFVFGQITPATNNNRFEYTCQVRRDPQTKMRVTALPVLRVADISLVVRTIRSFCEDMRRNVDIEADLYHAIRDTNALLRSNPTRKDLTALRTIVAVSQSLYLVRSRHAMLVCEYALYYVRDSLKHHISHSKD